MWRPVLLESRAIQLMLTRTLLWRRGPQACYLDPPGPGPLPTFCIVIATDDVPVLTRVFHRHVDAADFAITQLHAAEAQEDAAHRERLRRLHGLEAPGDA